MMAGLGYIFINDSIILRAARAFYQFGLSFAEHIIVLNDYNRRLIEQKHLCAPKNSFLEGGEGINIDNYKKYNNASNDTTFCLSAEFCGIRVMMSLRKQPAR